MTKKELRKWIKMNMEDHHCKGCLNQPVCYDEEIIEDGKKNPCYDEATNVLYIYDDDEKFQNCRNGKIVYRGEILEKLLIERDSRPGTIIKWWWRYPNLVGSLRELKRMIDQPKSKFRRIEL